LEAWRIGGLEDWRIGGLEDWGIGGLGDLAEGFVIFFKESEVLRKIATIDRNGGNPKIINNVTI
jgi:hypothetical protein